MNNYRRSNRGSRPFRKNNRFNSRRPSTAPAPRVSEAEAKFFSSVSVDPSPRIRLEAGSKEFTVRAIDLLCPIGMGQRGLLVAPPGSGKTTMLRHVCQAIMAAEPEMKVYCLLIDERPEEVTEFRRSVKAEVCWSSSDQSYDNHIKTARELMTKAYAEAGAGANVMILLDSLTRLARVHNSETRGRGRTLSGGMDASALALPRRMFGSARKIENGGSLGILATILVDTGSRMDEVIFQEFKGTGNMEIFLSREISGHRIFPAVDISKSGTRKEELLFTEDEREGARKVRSGLVNRNPVEAARTLREMFEKYSTNEDLIHSLNHTPT